MLTEKQKYNKEYHKKNKNNFIRNTTKIKCYICNYCFLKYSIKGHINSKRHYLKAVTVKYKKELDEGLILDICNL